MFDRSFIRALSVSATAVVLVAAMPTPCTAGDGPPRDAVAARVVGTLVGAGGGALAGRALAPWLIRAVGAAAAGPTGPAAIAVLTAGAGAISSGFNSFDRTGSSSSERFAQNVRFIPRSGFVT